jgi:hypothetical protein
MALVLLMAVVDSDNRRELLQCNSMNIGCGCTSFGLEENILHDGDIPERISGMLGGRAIVTLSHNVGFHLLVHKFHTAGLFAIYRRV